MNGFFIFLLTLLTYFETGSIFFSFFFFFKLLKEEIQLQAQLSLTLYTISMHILHTVLYTFPIGTDKENFPNE